VALGDGPVVAGNRRGRRRNRSPADGLDRGGFRAAARMRWTTWWLTSPRPAGKAEAHRARCQQQGWTSTRPRNKFSGFTAASIFLVNSAGINVPKRSWADMELEGWDRLVEINLNGVLYCMAPRWLPRDAGAKRRLHHQTVASWAGRHVSKNAGPSLHHHQSMRWLALTHSFNMDECVQRFARLLPVSRRGSQRRS